MGSAADAATLTWGSEGTGPGQFVAPYDIATLPSGDVFVSESSPAEPRIQRFNAAGAYLGEVGTPGAEPGELSAPTRLAGSPSGLLHVTDGNRMEVFAATGAFQGVDWGIGGAGRSAAVAPSGTVYVGDGLNRVIDMYSSEGESLGSFGGGYGGGPGQFVDPADLEVDADGNILVLDPGGGEGSFPSRIQKFSPSGSLLDGWVAMAPSDFPVSSYGFAIGPGGDLYVLDGLNRLVRWGPDGSLEGESQLAEPSVNLGGVGAWGNFVYVLDRTENRVLRIDVVTPDPALTAPAKALTGEPVSFDASASAVPAGRVVSYAWDLDGDGSFETETGATSTVTRSYPTRGTVTARVLVTSDLGGTAIAAHTLAVLPTPPAGPVGVSIEGGARYTNRPWVDVSVRWPRFASDLLVANDGGFVPSEQRPVAETIRWRLDPSGPERLPKTIYVRFLGGESGPETYQDDVILDRRPPLLSRVIAEPTRSRRVAARPRTRGGVRARLRIHARDGVSGLARMQVARRKAKPGKWRRFRARIVLPRTGRRVFIRVRDRAGNVSRWRRASWKPQRSSAKLKRGGARSIPSRSRAQ